MQRDHLIITATLCILLACGNESKGGMTDQNNEQPMGDTTTTGQESTRSLTEQEKQKAQLPVKDTPRTGHNTEQSTGADLDSSKAAAPNPPPAYQHSEPHVHP